MTNFRCLLFIVLNNKHKVVKEVSDYRNVTKASERAKCFDDDEFDQIANNEMIHRAVVGLHAITSTS